MEEYSNIAYRPHFSLIESFFLVTFNLFGDIVDLFSPVGIIGFFVGMIIGPITVFYLWMKGVPMISRNAIAQMLDVIPVIEWLPIRTVAIILTIMTVNHPNFLSKVGLGGKITKSLLKMTEKNKI